MSDSMIPFIEQFPLEIQSLPLLNRGKVRDIYDAGDNRLLIVASDRVSAFDVVLPKPMPGKGEALTEISNFWFALTQNRIRNHCLPDIIAQLITPEEYAQVKGRAVLVKRLKPLAIEAVIRGYLVGSGWKDYQATGQVCGIELPANLALASKMPTPIYTPATKAAMGDHDENIDYATTVSIVGEKLAKQVQQVSLNLYEFAADYALSKGIIIADTKFEFGLDEQDNLLLMDEIFTPDSSRFWDVAEYELGKNPPSYDKQIIRDYLETLDWDKTYPGPELPQAVLDKTIAQYHKALTLLQG